MKSAGEIFSFLPHDGFGLISCKDLAERRTQEDPPFILDIRKHHDWAKHRIPGSVHCEWEAVGDFIESGQLLEQRDVVVVCYVGQSSGQVTGILRALGYRAYSLLNGFTEWVESGYPRES
jgi:rhodanese-related sulfurtransferase